MDPVTVREAKSHLSRLLRRVEAGEEVIITRAGQPIARLVPYQQSVRTRQPGAWRGRVTLAPDFDDLPAQTLSGFRGEGS